MAIFSQKQSVLLGYYNYNHPISAPESPDIDFHDVFGGPPRRASAQEMRCSSGDTRDSFEFRGEDETISHRRHRWSGLTEKPVFGEEGVNRRRYASDDFFDDIFGGNDSLPSSPRDPLNLNPASKVLSPGRPISPRVSEPLTSSSLPAQSSLAGKLMNHHKNKEGISNGLFSHTPLSRFSTQVQGISLISDETASLEQPEEENKGSNLKKGSTDSQVPSVGHPFHFFIYKWASKRLPLSLSSRRGYNSKTTYKFKFDRSSSASGRIACEGMAKESPIVSPEASSCEIKIDNTKNNSDVKSNPVEEAISPGNSNFQDLKAEPGRISAAKQELRKSNTKALRSLFSGNNEGKEAEESEVKGAKKSSAAYDAGEKLSKQDEERTTFNNVDMEKTNTQRTPISSRDIHVLNRATGKIKEFVKIYDQETSEQSKLRDTSQNQSFRWKERGKFRTRDDQSLPTPNVNEDKPRTSTPVATEKAKTDNYKPRNVSSGVNGRSTSTSASTPNGSEARNGHVTDSFHENIEITELIQDEDEFQQAGNTQDEILATDAEIRKWSQGKQGNIRSLLSTLQYVLWSESGWKPVPLVDIIEGNAVKRSYQKALLSLHPDKLQQKGATLHQKCIAEKVFDVLQEAWTHFNSLGPM